MVLDYKQKMNRNVNDGSTRWRIISAIAMQQFKMALRSRASKMSVKVLRSNDTWSGMTYREDVASAKDILKKKVCTRLTFSLICDILGENKS